MKTIRVILRTILCAGLASSATTHAQAVSSAASGSENYVMTARAVRSVAATAGSTGYGLQATLGSGFVVSPAGSVNYAIQGGTASAEASLTGAAPLVFGTRAGRDRAPGGNTDRLLGFGFGAFASPVNVLLGGNLAGAGVVGNTAIDLTIPPGVNVHGNPLGPVEISVTISSGSIGEGGAFLFTPSLSAPKAARIGSDLCLRIETEPGATFFMNYGGTIPGTAIPVSPYAGALEIVSPLAVWPGQGATSDGHGTYTITMPVSKALVGQTISFQASVIESTSPLSAFFSNVTDVRILGLPGVQSPVVLAPGPIAR